LRLIRIVVLRLRRLRILLLVGIVVLLRWVLPLIGIVVLLRCWILPLIGIVVLWRRRILPLAGIAVGTGDPTTILIVQALCAGLRRGGRSVRITWIVGIARAVDIARIIRVPIRSAVT
jgi:hypothetical protein